MFRRRSLAAAVLTAGLAAAVPAARPAAFPAPAVAPPEAGDGDSDHQWKLGLRIAPQTGGGVLVVHVFLGSPAAAIGLRPGDALLAVDGELAVDPLRVRELIFAADRVKLLVRQGAGYVEKDVLFETALGQGESRDGTTVVKAKVVKKVVTRKVPGPAPGKKK